MSITNDVDLIFIVSGLFVSCVGILGMIFSPNSPAFILLFIGIPMVVLVGLARKYDDPKFEKYIQNEKNAIQALNNFKEFEANGFQFVAKPNVANVKQENES